MQKVNIGTSRFTEVFTTDDLGAGGAHHKYVVRLAGSSEVATMPDVAVINFQNGGVVESGVNGCHNEDLMAIVIHRLQCFQAGTFACRENAIALTKLEEAMHWLNRRTAARQARGVEGKSVV